MHLLIIMQKQSTLNVPALKIYSKRKLLKGLKRKHLLRYNHVKPHKHNRNPSLVSYSRRIKCVAIDNRATEKTSKSSAGSSSVGPTCTSTGTSRTD